MVGLAGHPLVVDERVVGVVAVWSRPVFSDAALRTLAAVADTLAVGIERKRALEALAESERLLRSVIDGTSDVVFVKDLAGRYVIANAAAAAIAGRSAEEMIGRTDEDIFPREVADRVRAADANVLATGEAQTYEDVIAEPNTGKSVTLLTTKGLYRDRTGRVAGVFGLARDITRHRQLEMELRQAQKMEAVGRLAGGIAHDFNNLLSIIMSYAGMLSADGPDSVSDPRDINEIMQAANRAAGLTRQLLAFSRQQVLEPRLLDLNELVTGVQKMLQRIIGEDIKSVTELAPELGHVRADPGQLEQVMLNLAVNARDAMPTGGVLRVTTQPITLDAAQAAGHPDMVPGRYVVLTVSDTGIGMDETTRARIFEPFFTTKEKGKGTGLGLSTVYGIVHQSGGFITVDSHVGRGTTFQVFFPFVSETSSTRVATPVGSQLVSAGHETILLIEDEDTLRRVAGHVLERGGYTLLTASNGAEAMVLAAQHTGRIDLIVTDVVMPGLNGREVVERLAPMHPEAKVLFISGYTDDTVLRLGILESNTPFMQKPFSALALARKVQELLRSDSDKQSAA
jgi:two-component system, cell cycle sensor histidine kinase and response regulator CckA